MRRVLSFDQSPPISAPLRFFLTAPIFSFTAALLLWWVGADALQSRWSASTLALTHLLVLGFLASVMLGALMQILPVVAGIDLPRIRLTARVVHVLLTTGVITLIAAFLLLKPFLFGTALVLLLSAFAWFIGACASRMWNIEGADATLKTIRFALTALLATLLLGATLAGGLAYSLQISFVGLTDLHARVGLLGWIGLLVIGVSYQVVPMFQVTPVYPPWLTRWLGLTLFGSLLLSALSAVLAPKFAAPLSTLIGILIAGSYLMFSAITLSLLWRRKRPKRDITTMFWWIGMLSLSTCAIVWLIGLMMPQVAAAPAYPLFLGVLFIIGFAYSAVNGMLYKIVPFLVWYHLQSRATQRGIVPNVKQIVPDRVAIQQYGAHLVALLLLLGAVLWPPMTRLAALAFGISSAYLWLNLVNAMRVYRRVNKLMAQTTATADAQ